MTRSCIIKTCNYLFIVGILLLVPGFPSPSFGGSATLRWDPPTHNTNGDPIAEGELVKYIIYYSLQENPYTDYDTVIDVGLTTTPNSPAYIINNLIEGELYYFTVTAVNRFGNESAPYRPSREKTIPYPVSIKTISLSETTVNAIYSAVLEAAEGTAPYKWTIHSDLPPGISLLSDTGKLVGIPSRAGNWEFSVTVEDASGATATKNLSILVNPPLPALIVPPMINIDQGNINSEFLFDVRGGIAPYQWSVISGTIPPGFVLNTRTGTLTGTPSNPGTYTFQIEVSDVYGSKTSATYTWTIHALPEGNIDFTTTGSENRVDGYDLIALEMARDTEPGSSGWNPLADLNRNGRIDEYDFSILERNFGNTYQP